LSGKPPNAPRNRDHDDHVQVIPAIPPAGGTATVEAAIETGAHAFRRFLKILGPGFITGASDDDPSGIGTYAVAGASLGFATLWTALVTLIRALVWSAMINGCLAPVLLCLIMLISNEPAVMGKRVNGTAMNWLGWITTGVMTAAVIGLIATTV